MSYPKAVQDKFHLRRRKFDRSTSKDQNTKSFFWVTLLMLLVLILHTFWYDTILCKADFITVGPRKR